MTGTMKDASTDEEVAVVFRNFYECPRCGTTWTDGWSSMCDDRCPSCGIEVSPFHSVEIGPPVSDVR
jgi:rubrerythrin